MTGAKWLAQERQEINRDREGQAIQGQAQAGGGECAAHLAIEPSRYPLLDVVRLDSLSVLVDAGCEEARRVLLFRVRRRLAN